MIRCQKVGSCTAQKLQLHARSNLRWSLRRCFCADPSWKFSPGGDTNRGYCSKGGAKPFRVHFGKNLDRISNLTRMILFDPPSTFNPRHRPRASLPRFDNMRPSQILLGGGGVPKGKFNQ